MALNLTTGNTALIIAECKKQGLLRNQAAYVLATAYHETGGKMLPVSESLNYSVSGLMNTFSRARISKADCEKYGRTSKQSANQQAIANCVYGGEWGRKNLGNTKQGDGWRNRGRGFVQITGATNYIKFGLENKPDDALKPAIAADILVRGMRLGMFTGRKLSDYITLSSSNFFDARDIINPDKNRIEPNEKTSIGNKIAGYAREYDRLLLADGYGVETTIPDTPAAPTEPLIKSKRLITWLGTVAATVTGFLHPAAQVACVAVVGGIAAYAIYSMPQVREAISRIASKL